MTEDVCGLFGVKPPLYRRRMDFYISDAAFDSSRARKVLGWEPKVSLRDGLALTMRATATASGSRSLGLIASTTASLGKLLAMNETLSVLAASFI
jgi:hypothetical protein